VDLATDIQGLQGTLNGVYNDMLPMCSQFIGVGRAIAGFGALWFIGSRVWRQIASAEPIDFYPLMRPFALGLAILLYSHGHRDYQRYYVAYRQRHRRYGAKFRCRYCGTC
jgi:hypothetical protein